MPYSNPSAPVIDNPIGLDRSIASLQQAVSQVSWMQKAFGRAFLMPEQDRQTPKVYAGEGEYYNCLFNDNLNAYSFIQVTGADEVQNEEDAFGELIFSTPVALIVYGNSQALNFSDNALESLKKDILSAVRNVSDFQPKRIVHEGIREVFKGYDLPEVANQLYHPYFGMRVEGLLNWIEKC